MSTSSRRTRKIPITRNFGKEASSRVDDQCDLDEGLDLKETQEEAGKE